MLVRSMEDTRATSSCYDSMQICKCMCVAEGWAAEVSTHKPPCVAEQPNKRQDLCTSEINRQELCIFGDQVERVRTEKAWMRSGRARADQISRDSPRSITTHGGMTSPEGSVKLPSSLLTMLRTCSPLIVRPQVMTSRIGLIAHVLSCGTHSWELFNSSNRCGGHRKCSRHHCQYIHSRARTQTCKVSQATHLLLKTQRKRMHPRGLGE